MYLSTEAVRVIHEQRVAEAQKLAQPRSMHAKSERFAWLKHLMQRNPVERRPVTHRTRRANI